MTSYGQLRSPGPHMAPRVCMASLTLCTSPWVLWAIYCLSGGDVDKADQMFHAPTPEDIKAVRQAVIEQGASPSHMIWSGEKGKLDEILH